MTLLQPELYAEESALDTFGVVILDDKACFDSAASSSLNIKNSHRKFRFRFSKV